MNTSRIQGKPNSQQLHQQAGQVLKWDGNQWAPNADNSDGFSLPFDASYDGDQTAFQLENPTMGTKASLLTESGNILQLGPSGEQIAPNGLLDIENSFKGIFSMNINNSSGSGGGIYIHNSDNNALYIDNYSNSDAVEIDNSGNGGRALVIDNGGNDEVALWVSNLSNNYAAYFDGDVHVTGTLSKSGGSFEIDDPIDPANKILRHSFVESPDMMNIYNGNVTTDASGNATIELPDYFSALNMDFRYQLTVIGQFAEAIVSKEIQNNQFTITTNKPNVKVSWQVTGIRKNPWAQKNRIIVEEQKSSKTKGFYLNPKAYGLPTTKSVEWALHPEMMKRTQEKINELKADGESQK